MSSHKTVIIYNTMPTCWRLIIHRTLAPWHPGVHINKPITATAKDNLQKIKNCGVLRNPMMHHSQTD